VSEPAFMPEPVNAWDSPPPPEHFYWDQIDDRVLDKADAVMWTWTVYHGTIDAPPGWFIVRPFLIGRGGDEPVPYTGYLARTLEQAREPLEMMGLWPMARNDEDPKGVIETWV